MFVGGVTGVCLTREHLVLEAIAAERMPHRLVVSGVERSAFFELRNYESGVPLEIFERHGIRAVLRRNGRYLFAFESLAARERAWRELSADSHWIAAQRNAPLKEIALYRVERSL
jgi:hypothetical protein